MLTAVIEKFAVERIFYRFFSTISKTRIQSVYFSLQNTYEMYDARKHHIFCFCSYILGAKEKCCGCTITKKIALYISGTTQNFPYDNIQNKTLKSTVISKCLWRHVSILKVIRY